MTFDWLNKFHQRIEKEQTYAEKTLAAYAFGMKAKGSVVGVSVQIGPDCCDAARHLSAGKVYLPNEAPHLPLPNCPQGNRCGCVYRPVMKYSGGATHEHRSRFNRAMSAKPPSQPSWGQDGFVGNGLASALRSQKDRIRSNSGRRHSHRSRPKSFSAKRTSLSTAEAFEYGRAATTAIISARMRDQLPPSLRGFERTRCFFTYRARLCSAKARGLETIRRANPKTFPSPAYALAKFEEDCYLERVAAERGFQVVFLRPAVVYSRQGAGMVDTMLKLAKRGIALRLYPREARHHLVHMSLLADVARRIIIQRNERAQPEHLGGGRSLHDHQS